MNNKTIWIVWKDTTEDKNQIHAVCSTREMAAKENIKQRRKGVQSWIGSYMMDAIVGWQYKDSIPLLVQ